MLGTQKVPRSSHRLDDLLVDLVAVVDQVDAGLDALGDQLAPGGVGADPLADFVRGLDRGDDLVVADAAEVRLGDAVPAGRQDLDPVGAASDLGAHLLAHLLGPVDEDLHAGVAAVVPPVGTLVAGGLEVRAAGEQARAVDQPLVHRHLQAGVEVVAARRARPPSCSPDSSSLRQVLMATAISTPAGRSAPS